MEIIRLEHIDKYFGERKALDDFSLSVKEGEFLTVIGRSGCGKTTLLRILMGLEKPDDDFGGHSELEALKKSAVFQEDRLCESFSPMDNVMMCVGRSLKASRVRLEMGELLPEECLDRPVSTLSGGMKRRVAVARALLIPSHILLMDEPFTGMDDELKRNVISYIREKQDGRLLILSTHQEEDVELMGGELVRLENCMDV